MISMPSLAPGDKRAGARRIRGLYAVTPEDPDTERLERRVRDALAGGAAAVQYRSKSSNAALRAAQALRLRSACRDWDALLVVNDDVELALEAGADGVHLGRDDGDLAAARSRLGPGMLLGASCYDRIELAFEAVAAGADYVAFGAAYASPTKPGAASAPLELFRRARQSLAVPVVAIGGITAHNASALIEAGVDAVAVITAVFASDDITAAAAAFQELFERYRR